MWSSAAEPRFWAMKPFSIRSSAAIRCVSRFSSSCMSRLRTWPLELTTNGAQAMPKKPGPSLPPPTETNGGISRSDRWSISSCDNTAP